MSLFELFVIAIGLSMDAFAVSVCKGLSVGKVQVKHVLTAGIYFGGFQAIMPFLGYTLGVQFSSLIESFDHWIAFVLLGIIGFNMIKESCKCADELNSSFSFTAMFPLAVATSIDALAVGVTFAAVQIENIGLAVTLIGIITFILSAVGIKAGNVFGLKYKSKAEKLGGIVLILIGIKILIEHIMQ